MVRYHSEPRSSETAVGGNSKEPGWHHFRERDGICVGEIHRTLHEAAMRVSCQMGEHISPTTLKPILTTQFER